MTMRIDCATPEDAPVIALLAGELLHEIMAAVKEKAFNFQPDESVARARAWLAEGTYTVLLARDGVGREPLGFLALCQSYALYTEGVFGTIPEFFVRPAHRSKGIGRRLLAEAARVGAARGWRRLEVTTPPLPQFERTMAFYQREGFTVSGGRKLKRELA